MKSRLDLIEEKIKRLFEHGAAVLPWMDEQSVLLHHISESIHGCFDDPDFDCYLVPEKFIFYLNPRDVRYLEQQKDWQEALLPLINESALDHAIKYVKKPEIWAVAKNSLASTEVQVKIIYSTSIQGQTGAVPIDSGKETSESSHSCSKAALLLDNEILFDLEGPVINIGRKSNNHLVINDLRVSRNHAQIRAVSEGYIIFDTGSSGGTYINGERVTQHVLKPGDVISLAGIKMIFTQDQSTLREESRQITSEMKTPAKEE